MRDHSQKDDDTEINMTPMLDIVFIMLIFFIVTAVFVKESGFDVTKPQTKTGYQRPAVSILIAITDKNQIYINRKVVEIDAVRTVIKKLHAENPRGSISIQPDQASSAVTMMKVYDAVRDAGVEDISISTENK